jgi:hypothetical protein
LQCSLGGEQVTIFEFGTVNPLAVDEFSCEPMHHDGKHSGLRLPSDQADAEALVHELTEAHTALGNYLLAARKIVEGGPGSRQARLCEVIDAAIGQSERANNALRQLRKLLRRR